MQTMKVYVYPSLYPNSSEIAHVSVPRESQRLPQYVTAVRCLYFDGTAMFFLFEILLYILWSTEIMMLI